MKQQDIAVVIVIVFITGVAAYFVSSTYITPTNEKLVAPVVGEITTDYQLPDKTVFNAEAINPTKVIQIAPNQNNQPFTNDQ